jgi:hypothetical protein
VKTKTRDDFARYREDGFEIEEVCQREWCASDTYRILLAITRAHTWTEYWFERSKTSYGRATKMAPTKECTRVHDSVPKEWYKYDC